MKTITLYHTGTYKTAKDSSIYYSSHREESPYIQHYFIGMDGDVYNSLELYDETEINVCLVGLFDDELTHAQKDSLNLLYHFLAFDSDEVDIKFDESSMHNYLSDSKQQELISYLSK